MRKAYFRCWHFTIFGCTAEIGRDPANATSRPSQRQMTCSD
jgi:hypothetical protein